MFQLMHFVTVNGYFYVKIGKKEYTGLDWIEPSLYAQLSKWCSESFGHKHWTNLNSVFFFDKEEDKAAFVLRWMSHVGQ